MIGMDFSHKRYKSAKARGKFADGLLGIGEKCLWGGLISPLLLLAHTESLPWERY